MIEETTEYYEKQAITFLTDICKERDKTIKILANLLVGSVLINLCFIAIWN